MNGDSIPNNSKVIHFVVATVCVTALVCVATQAWCYINKVPDMNTPLAGAFLHVTDTLVGALIAMLINTRPAQQQKPDSPSTPTPVEIKQPENHPVPVTETPKP